MTLGRFDALERGEGELVLRPGIAEALDTLTDAGFVHVLLTLGSPTYAGLALTISGLADRFAAAYGRGDPIGKGDAEAIGAAFAIDPRERPHRMLFVGDHPLYDPPRDPRVVFHLETHALARPAADVAALIVGLRELGRGSLSGGAERLLRRRWLERGAGVRRRTIGALDPLVVARPDDGPPVIAFEGPPRAPAEGRRVPLS